MVLNGLSSSGGGISVVPSSLSRQYIMKLNFIENVVNLDTLNSYLNVSINVHGVERR